MTEKNFMGAVEVSEYLNISRSKAYKIIAALNSELKENGYLTISGKINRTFFESKANPSAFSGR